MAEKDNIGAYRATEPIDFVIPWVDGLDPSWQSERAKYSSLESSGAEAKWNAGAQRYRDWGVLKYWFRGVDKFAPWVRKIHFVTWGHVPEWLDTTNPRLNIVRHKDYIPEKYLPTFSSHTIELNFHRLPGLARQFVYFNDDMFPVSPLKPTDFFTHGLPRDAAIESAIHLTQNGIRAEIDDLYIINANFDKRKCRRGNFFKWWNPLYKGKLIRSLLSLPYGNFIGFFIEHASVAYLKDTFEEVWAKEGAKLDETCRHKFRTPGDVNQWLMQYWQFASGKFSPRSTSFAKSFEGFDKFDAACEAIAKGKYKVVCWNDSPDIENFEAAKTKLANAFERRLGDKCPFER